MEYIIVIMSGLALLAAIVCLILLVQEKKRNQERNAALLDYVDKECDTAREWAKRMILEKNEGVLKCIDASVSGAKNELTEKMSEDNMWMNKRIDKLYNELRTDVKNLMDGVVPDYNEALAAKQAVDNFNLGLSAIMGFDPLDAARKSRQERLGAEVK